jgi:hypothetical protein
LESVSDGWVQVIKDIYKFHQPDAWKDWHPLHQLPKHDVESCVNRLNQNSLERSAILYWKSSGRLAEHNPGSCPVDLGCYW